MPDLTAKGVPYAKPDDSNSLVLHTKGLADFLDANPGIAPLTTAQRDGLTAPGLWDWRVIANLTTGRLQRYDAAGAVWRDIVPTTAAAISYAGSTDLVATNVEAALDELDAEKISIAAANAAFVARDALNHALVPAAEGTTSATFTDLATVGPQLTSTVPASGRVLVIVGGTASHSAAGGDAYMGVTLTGAHLTSASQANAFAVRSAVAGQLVQGSRVFVLTGLTPGSVTFTAKYRIDGAAGTATFQNRTLIVLPL